MNPFYSFTVILICICCLIPCQCQSNEGYLPITDWNYVQLVNQFYQDFNRRLMALLNIEDDYQHSVNLANVGELLDEDVTVSCYKKENLSGKQSVVNYYIEASTTQINVIRTPGSMFVKDFQRSNSTDSDSNPIVLISVTLEYFTQIYQTNQDRYSHNFISRTFQIDIQLVDIVCTEYTRACRITKMVFDYLQYPKKIGNFNDIL